MRSRHAQVALFTICFVFLVILTLPLWISIFIFRPERLSNSDPHAWRLPQAREVWIASGSRRLSAWWLRATKPDGATVLLIHGRSSNISTRAYITEQLANAGFGVLSFDFSGYGASTGRPSEANLLEDSEAAYAWLIGNGVRPNRVVVLGQSLGNASAAKVAADHPVAGLVLVSPFTSLPGAGRDRFGWLPIDWLPWVVNRYEVASFVAKLDIPVVLVASRSDGLVPMRNTNRLASIVKHPVWVMDDRFTHDGLLTGGIASGDLLRAMARFQLKPASAK